MFLFPIDRFSMLHFVRLLNRKFKTNICLCVHRGESLRQTVNSPVPLSTRGNKASATLNGKIYLFSSRGGVAMAPIEESGSIWEFDPTIVSWSLISSDSGSGVYPVARSYHCMASDSKDILCCHASCPEKGRLSDLWAFSLTTKKWTELA